MLGKDHLPRTSAFSGVGQENFPIVLAPSINDWFRDEAQDNEAENPMQDGPARFLGLSGRVGRVLAIVSRAAKAGSRYVAYSSDVGEAFRPLVSPTFVRATYGIAYAYVAADVALATYGTHQETHGDVARCTRTAVETLSFQLIASIAVPSLIIHTAVHGAQKAVKGSTGMLARYGPTAVGLAIIPILPFTIDSPIEHFIEEAFEKFWPVEEGTKHELEVAQPSSDETKHEKGE